MKTHNEPQRRNAIQSILGTMSYSCLPNTVKGLRFFMTTFRKGESRTKSVFPGATGPQTAKETRRNGAAEQHPAITIITSRYTLDGLTSPFDKVDLPRNALYWAKFS